MPDARGLGWIVLGRPTPVPSAPASWSETAHLQSQVTGAA